MYIRQEPSGGCAPGCFGCFFATMIFGVAFFVLTIVTLLMVGIGIIIFLIVRWLVVPQPRLFGAWPISRWSDAYEHGLFSLESWTGIDFNSTPLRILRGTLILTLIPLI